MPVTTFINPILLLGVLGAVAPIIVHLALREKPREEPFPTLRFLRSSKRRTSRPLKLKQFILLLLRVAAVALFALALARPVARIGWLPEPAAREVALAVVLDDSLRMAYEVEGRSSFDRARDAATALVGGLAPASPVAVVPASQARGYLTRLRDTALGHLDAAALTLDAEPVWPAIAEGFRLLNTVAGPREIHVFTDMSADAWQAFAAAALPPDSGIRLIVHDVGPERDENVAIEGIEVTRRPHGPGAFTVEAAVRGGSVEGRRAVDLVVNGRRRASAEAALSPGSAASVTLDSPPEPGDDILRGAVEAPGYDPLPIDNHFYFTIRPPATIPAAVVSRLDFDDGDSLAFVVSAMLMPSREHRLVNVLPMTPEVLAAASEDGLAAFHTIFLLDAGPLGEDTARRLGTYLRRGGVLVALSGEHALNAPPDWSPGREGGVARPDELARLSLGREAHPLWRALTDEEIMAFGDVPFGAWRKLDGVAGGTEVLARLEGDAAIVHRPVGRGHVLWFASGGDVAWTPLHRRDALFLTLLHELARFGRRDERPAAYRLGDTVPLSVPPAMYAEGDAYAVQLDGAPDPVVVTIDPVNFQGAFTGADAPGHYRFQRLPRGDRERAQTLDIFAVNIDPAATRLTRIDPAELAARLPEGAVVPGYSAGEAMARSETLYPREIFAFVMLTALMVATVEGFLANRFYKT